MDEPIKVVDQADTRPATVGQIMQSKAFRQGFEEKRAGREFRYDEEFGDDGNDTWEYERGRQLATAAPRDMPLMIGRNFNPKAVVLFYTLKLGEL